MTLVDDLVAWAATAHAAAPLYATDLVVGPRFTAVGAASRPNGVTLLRAPNPTRRGGGTASR